MLRHSVILPRFSDWLLLQRFADGSKECMRDLSRTFGVTRDDALDLIYAHLHRGYSVPQDMGQSPGLLEFRFAFGMYLRLVRHTSCKTDEFLNLSVSCQISINITDPCTLHKQRAQGHQFLFLVSGYEAGRSTHQHCFRLGKIEQLILSSYNLDC
jgi:hypothetical protein